MLEAVALCRILSKLYISLKRKLSIGNMGTNQGVASSPSNQCPYLAKVFLYLYTPSHYSKPVELGSLESFSPEVGMGSPSLSVYPATPYKYNRLETVILLGDIFHPLAFSMKAGEQEHKVDRAIPFLRLPSFEHLWSHKQVIQGWNKIPTVSRR
jgi:hypothetical protein